MFEWSGHSASWPHTSGQSSQCCCCSGVWKQRIVVCVCICVCSVCLFKSFAHFANGLIILLSLRVLSHSGFKSLVSYLLYFLPVCSFPFLLLITMLLKRSISFLTSPPFQCMCGCPKKSFAYWSGLSRIPPKSTSTWNAAVFGNVFFADIIKGRSCKIKLRWTLNPVVSLQKEERTQRDTAEGPGETDRGRGGWCPATGHGVPAASRSCKRWGRILLQGFKGNVSWLILWSSGC